MMNEVISDSDESENTQEGIKSADEIKMETRKIGLLFVSGIWFTM